MELIGHVIGGEEVPASDGATTGSALASSSPPRGPRHLR